MTRTTVSNDTSATDMVRLEAGLASLREPVPEGFRHDTLVAVGLADDYAIVTSPVGPLRIAWNGRGVSAVDGAADDAAFEARLTARTGRPAVRRAELPPRHAAAV